ncbi:MAG TPA: hypothetical protein GXX75_08295 [Clostridiales bacterium]|nr:hypothetical protein [Clostridiales bacterium]
MLYLISAVILIIALMIYPKSEKKHNILQWLPVVVIAYECWTCFLTGLMTIIHIDVNMYTVAICNIILSVFLIIRIFKCKIIQKYYIKIEDIVFFAIYICVIWLVWINRYTTDLLIRFETSDPGTHLKFAMDFINNQAVNGMYLGQVTNGLFIEGLFKFFSGAYVYKTFIIKYGINFFIAGLMFYAATIGYADKFYKKFIVYAVTMIYILGYPYNDMIFGFVYLQMTITIVSYLLLVTYFYLEAEKNNYIYMILISLGCLGVGIGYTLFAPITFIAILIVVIYKANKEKWLIGKRFLHKEFIKVGLEIFLIPSLFTIWFLIIQPLIEKDYISYASSLNIEGYIYRNLYSDFLLFIVFSIYGIIVTLKNKKINLNSILLILSTFFYVFFYIMMIDKKVSTYYFYKINYLLWLLILVSFTIGILEMIDKEKKFVISYLVVILMLFTVRFTDFEQTYNAKNVNYIPFSDSESFFHIYTTNKVLNERKSEVKIDLVNISNEVNKSYKDGRCVFVGNWLECFWYEALTNQRFESGYVQKPVDKLMEEFYYGQSGKYIVILKESEEYLNNQSLFEKLEKVYENDYAIIGIK